MPEPIVAPHTLPGGEGASGGIKGSLTKKLGPLPAWAWIGAGGVGLWFIMSRRGGGTGGGGGGQFATPGQGGGGGGVGAGPGVTPPGQTSGVSPGYLGGGGADPVTFLLGPAGAQPAPPWAGTPAGGGQLAPPWAGTPAGQPAPTTMAQPTYTFPVAIPVSTPTASGFAPGPTPQPITWSPNLAAILAPFAPAAQAPVIPVSPPSPFQPSTPQAIAMPIPTAPPPPNPITWAPGYGPSGWVGPVPTTSSGAPVVGTPSGGGVLDPGLYAPIAPPTYAPGGGGAPSGGGVPVLTS